MPKIGYISNFNGQDFVYDGLEIGWRQKMDAHADAIDAINRQVGGDHYKDMRVQPIEYILANDLPFIEGAVVKYVSRWRQKGGVDDLRKAIHMLELLVEHQK